MLNASGSPNVPRRWLNASTQIGLGLHLPVAGEPTGEVVVPDVEARQLVQRDALVEDRVRLAAEDLDVVAEVDQRLGEVAGVDALATDVRLAAVGEIGDERGASGESAAAPADVTADIGPSGYRCVVTDW